MRFGPISMALIALFAIGSGLVSACSVAQNSPPRAGPAALDTRVNFVFFRASSTILTKAAKKNLDYLAQKFVAGGGRQINIVGFASHIADPVKSAELARLYEGNVRDYLVSRSIPESSIVTGQYYGADAARTLPNMRKNGPARRRVEIQLH